MTLPQPEVPIFSGDTVGYSDFVRAFENLIQVHDCIIWFRFPLGMSKN